jgi:hypothetical protein
MTCSPPFVVANLDAEDATDAVLERYMQVEQTE